MRKISLLVILAISIALFSFTSEKGAKKAGTAIKLAPPQCQWSMFLRCNYHYPLSSPDATNSELTHIIYYPGGDNRCRKITCEVDAYCGLHGGRTYSNPLVP